MSRILLSCPICRRAVDWKQAPFRPFCSERCRLLDLGAWLSEQRKVPGDAAAADDAVAEQAAPPDRARERSS